MSGAGFLLDTSVLIWWLAEPSRLGAAATKCIADPDNQICCSVVNLWEIQIKVFEEDAIGTGVGLIRSERLDRLALRRSERGNRRSDEAHRQALRRLELLLHHSGGIYFGNDLKSQLRLASPNARIRSKQLVTLRFCCQGWCFAFIREGLQRYPIEHTRFSRPLAGEHWWHHANAPHVLKPGSPSDTHPYPVELDLPPWTVERDIDLRNWLFGFGAGIRIDSPGGAAPGASGAAAGRPGGVPTGLNGRTTMS